METTLGVQQSVAAAKQLVVHKLHVIDHQSPLSGAVENKPFGITEFPTPF